MAQSSLLQDCRNYFQQAQSSWDAFFSKWEALAKEDVEEKDELFSNAEAATTPRRARYSATRQLLKKSIVVLNRKRLNSNGERKWKWKSVRVQGGKSRDRKRETEIIHTTENQTNLECEVVNNKHFEADLKAIFIEILSENTNKMGMFSVLSRTFSGNGETISNFSLSSMIMEKNGFSISPVSKSVLHPVSSNAYLLGGKSPLKGTSDAPVLPCVSVTPSQALNALNDMRMGLWLSTPGTIANDTPCKFMKSSTDMPRSIPSLVTNSQKDSLEELNHSDCVSPEATLSKILSTSGCARRKCLTKKTSNGKRIKSVLVSSDDDSEDDAKMSPGRFLKIFCTSKKPRRGSNSATGTVSDDDECFRIFDRVKTEKN